MQMPPVDEYKMARKRDQLLREMSAPYLKQYERGILTHDELVSMMMENQLILDAGVF